MYLCHESFTNLIGALKLHIIIIIGFIILKLTHQTDCYKKQPNVWQDDDGQQTTLMVTSSENKHVIIDWIIKNAYNRLYFFLLKLTH